jgi:hypothetical protein
MIEYLVARARLQEVEAAVRKAEWVRWWPARPANVRKERGL